MFRTLAPIMTKATASYDRILSKDHPVKVISDTNEHFGTLLSNAGKWIGRILALVLPGKTVIQIDTNGYLQQLPGSVLKFPSGGTLKIGKNKYAN